MFHDETMPSFFRRPSYSPDGSLLIVPGQLSLSNNKHCYIASKTFTQQNEHCDWLILGHVPLIKSNVSRPGYNCTVVAHTKSLFVCFCYMKVKIYDKTLNVWSLGKLVSFVFPRVLMFPSTSSRQTNCFPQDHTLSV